MSPWPSLLLAVALSIDSVGTGLAYGLRNIRIPLGPLAVVGLCTGAMMGLSMALGAAAAPFVPPGKASSLGGAVLIAIGLWQLATGWRQYLGHYEGSTPERPLLHLRIASLGVAVQVLRDPAVADADRSGAIDGREPWLLGTALGLDAFGAGFGAAMAGFPFWIVPLVAATCMVSVYAGSWAGKRAAARWPGGKSFALPGLLLILLGVAQF